MVYKLFIGLEWKILFKLMLSWSRTRILNSIAFPHARLEELSATPPQDRGATSGGAKSDMEGTVRYFRPYFVGIFPCYMGLKDRIFLLVIQDSHGK